MTAGGLGPHLPRPRPRRFRVTHAAWNHMRDAGLRPHHHHRVGRRHLRQLRPGELLDGEARPRRLRADARDRGQEEQRPRQHDRADRRLAHDRDRAPEGAHRRAQARVRLAARRLALPRVCEETGGALRGRRRLLRASCAGSAPRARRSSSAAPITPEEVQAQVERRSPTSSKATHPTDITESMQPILGEPRGRSEQGRQRVHRRRRGARLRVPAGRARATTSATSRSTRSASAPRRTRSTRRSSRYVYEMSGDGFKALPTFGVVPALNVDVRRSRKKGKQAPGPELRLRPRAPRRAVHRAQAPAAAARASSRTRSKIKDIFDKGKNAVVVTAITTYDETGDELVVQRAHDVRARRRRLGRRARPERRRQRRRPTARPTRSSRRRSTPNQALLYRLSRRLEPAPRRPGVREGVRLRASRSSTGCARSASRRAHVIKAFCRRATRASSRASRCASPTACSPARRSSPRCGRRATRDRLPHARSRSATRSSSRTPRSSSTRRSRRPKAEAEGRGGGRRRRRGRRRARRAPTSSPASATTSRSNPRARRARWQDRSSSSSRAPTARGRIDLKNGAGHASTRRRRQGRLHARADRRRLHGDGDRQGRPEKLYIGGKLKITGNVMASQKLDVPEEDRSADGASTRCQEARRRRRRRRRRLRRQRPAPTRADERRRVRRRSSDYIEQNADLAAKVGDRLPVQAHGPRLARGRVDLKTGKGRVTPGDGRKADCTLELADADFLDMTSGKADPQKLFMAAS